MTKVMKVGLKFLGEHGAPFYADIGSAGVDLCAQVSMVIAPGETVKVPTGMFVDIKGAIDPNWEVTPFFQVVPRSGLSLNSKLRVANSPGTIDISYPDEICVILDNVGTKTETIIAGHRVAQILLQTCHRIKGIPTKPGVRQGGFGSSGV